MNIQKNSTASVLISRSVLVKEEEIEEAYTQVDRGLIEIIRKALKNIETYHEKQRQYSWFDSKPDGTILGQKVTALRSGRRICAGRERLHTLLRFL